MGVRFDKWLARPSTLHFLRQLIGPEYAATTTRPRRRPAALPRNSRRSYTSAPASIPKPSQHGTVKRNLNPQSAAAKETYHEQRRRVAKELGLRIPEDEDESRTAKDGSIPAWTSYSDLIYAEARVRDNSSTRGLLIDHPANQGNIEAWSHILEYRERTDGFNGVLDVWKGMRKRGINLPIDGEFADMFWTTFLHNAIIKNADESHKSLLREVYAYAKDLKTAGMGHYQSFYKTLIGRILRVVPGEARQLGPEREWHTRTQVEGFRPEKALSEVMLDVLKSSRPDVASRRFRRMYHDDADRNLYDFCMPVVLSHASDDLSTIMQWHNFFVLNDDMPSPELADTAPIKNLIRLAGAHDGKLVLSRDERRDLIAFFNENRAAQRNLDILGLSRASMNSLVGDVHGIKPKAVSDEFCARMFATRAFALETIIRGIALLGIEAVGPVALRELAIRAVSPSVFKARLTDIEDSGVQLVPSIYTRLLEKTATGSNADLFQALLNSDQHPENYDEKHMQETLLSSFLESEDFSQIHLTVLALSLADHEMAARAWNRVLQHHIKAQNYVEFLRIYNELGVHQLRLTTRSLNFMMDHFLHERSPSKRPNIWSKPDAARLVPLEFVINAHLYAAEHGSDIPLDRWVELLKRCGMTGKMEDLASLSSWLAARYSQPSQGVLSDDVYSGSSPYLRKTYAINYVFDRPMVRALVIWGFRKAAEYDELRTPPDQQIDKLGLNPGLAKSEASNEKTKSWTQGIALVLQLKRLGVRVRAKDVRRAVEEALWPLFGPAFSDRKINSRSIRRNHLGLAQYVKDVNEVWDRPVFEISEELLMDDHPHAKAKLLPEVFGYERLVDQKEGTWVDVEAWALADGTWHEPFATHRERQKNWEEFPFKFSDNLTSKERYRSGRHRPLRKRPERPLASTQDPVPAIESSNDATTSEESLTLPQNPPPAAQTSNSHPPPSPPNTPEDS